MPREFRQLNNRLPPGGNFFSERRGAFVQHQLDTSPRTTTNLQNLSCRSFGSLMPSYGLFDLAH